MNTNAAARTYDWKQAKRLTAILSLSQLGGVLSIDLARSFLQRLPVDSRAIVARCEWVGLVLTALAGLCWAVRLSEHQRLLRLRTATVCLIVLDAVLLVFVIHATGGLFRSPFSLLLVSIPFAIFILRFLPKNGWLAFVVQSLLMLAGLWHWRLWRPGANATGSAYDVFADPGFLGAFAILASFGLLLSVFCLTLRKSEMADMAANAFFAGGGHISYANRMGRRG